LPNLELNINTNFGVKPILIERLADKVNSLLAGNKIGSFKVFTSLDTWGPRAEYIRTGLDLEVWERNFDMYLTKTNQPITFMMTFNILTVTSFTSLLEKVLEWRVKYNVEDQTKWQRVRFDTPHLKEPLQYDMNIIPKDKFVSYMYDHLKFIEDNLDDNNKHKFSQLEYDKFSRVVKYMETTEYSETKVTDGRQNFVKWFDEYDRRRNTNLLETFPEMKEFYFECMQLI
jgi:hypothetical protein